LEIHEKHRREEKRRAIANIDSENKNVSEKEYKKVGSMA
jgi:hypothetical protein